MLRHPVTHSPMTIVCALFCATAAAKGRGGLLTLFSDLFPPVVPNSTKVADEEKKFRDCADLYQAGVHKNGVYTIQINPQETRKVQSSQPAVGPAERMGGEKQNIGFSKRSRSGSHLPSDAQRPRRRVTSVNDGGEPLQER